MLINARCFGSSMRVKFMLWLLWLFANALEANAVVPWVVKALTK